MMGHIAQEQVKLNDVKMLRDQNSRRVVMEVDNR